MASDLARAPLRFISCMDFDGMGVFCMIFQVVGQVFGLRMLILSLEFWMLVWTLWIRILAWPLMWWKVSTRGEYSDVVMRREEVEEAEAV